MNRSDLPFRVAVACGGTGGHLFPGLAVAEVLRERGCEIVLLVSQKEVDQEGVKAVDAVRVLSLPAVALQDRRWMDFGKGFWKSYRLCYRAFEELRPQAVLAMGGFTSAPPVLAGKRLGAAAFLHESNSIPGRANRWLSPWVDEIFVGFPTAARRLYHQSIRHYGTPVRPQFVLCDPAPCRMALGLDPSEPVLLVMGGSQGASAINKLITGALPLLAAKKPNLQFIHLTGPDDFAAVQEAYRTHGRRATVRPFLTEMELGLGAATMAVNRAGASSLAELAAMQVPALLIPYPHAMDNHQFHNARLYDQTGAGQLLEQAAITSETLARAILGLLADPATQQSMKAALARWHTPQAAADMADRICGLLGVREPDRTERFAAGAKPKVLSGRWAGPNAMAMVSGKPK